MDIGMKDGEIRFRLRAGALILTGEKLLAVQADGTDIYYTVGGRLRIGESSAEAAEREAFEETGCRMKAERLLFVHESFFGIGGSRYHEVCFYYLMKPDGDIPGRRTDHEEELLVWLPLAELHRLPLMPSFLRMALQQSLPDTPVHLITRE